MAVTTSRAPVLELKIGGGSLKMEYQAAVIEVRVEQAMSMADRAVIRIADADLSLVDGDTFAVGHAVEVLLGAPDSSKRAAEVFTGEIVTIEADIGVGGTQLTVIALDKSHRLRRKTTTKAWMNATVADIAHKLASQNGLRAGQIETGGPPLTEVFQHDESDWQLLERLANDAGCDIDVDAGKLQLLQRRAAGSPVELTLGVTLKSFRPRLSGVAQVDAIELRSWNAQAKDVVSETVKLSPSVSAQERQRNTAASALGGGTLVIADRPAENTAHAKQMATAVANRLGATVIEATAVAIGDPAIRAGGVVSLKGVGKRFGGEHRVVTATHILRGGRGYETRFTVGAGGGPLVQELGARPRPSGFAAHLVIGLVTQNKDSQGRVKVKYPTLDNRSETTWVRVAQPAAGKGRGLVALPQIGDEVVIGFEHGDIERPIVLGSLFNGTDLPGSALPAESTPQSLAVTMPGDVVTTVDGQVKTTAQKGVEVSSQGPVSIAASGAAAQMKITAQAPLEITGQQTVKLTGLMTTIEGQTETQISANGAIQIKSNGAISIQGSAVTVTANGPLALKGSPVILG